MKRIVKQLFSIAAVTVFGSCLAHDEKGVQLTDPNQLRFAAAEKWSDEKAGLIGGGIGAGVGFLAVAAGHSDHGSDYGLGMIVGGAIGAGVGVVRNRNYNRVYDAAEGKTIHGAAAANNAAGVKAWIDYNGKDQTYAQDVDGVTPLMYAAGNGAMDSAKMISDFMPSEYEVIDSTVEKEEETRSMGKGLQERLDLDNYLFPEKTTTKSKAVRRKRVKTADIKANDGRTAFHWAVDGNHIHLAQYLVKRGKANATLEDNCGRSINKNMTVNGKPAFEVITNCR